MDSSKGRIAGITGTVGFHILLIILLVFLYIKPSPSLIWSEEMEGVPVMFGNVPDAFGSDEPFGRGENGQINDNTEAPNEIETAVPQDVAVPNTGESTVATQDFEETVNITPKDKAEEERKKREAAVAERERKERADAERKASEEAKRKQDINNQMAGLFGNGSGSGSRGETEGTGTQGVPTGNASYGKTSGVGGWGTYDLGGRGVGRGGLVKPSYTANDYGTVVIDIIVDPQGNVVSADIGRGTNTPSTTLKNEALKAARRTKFAVVNKAGNQKGTITYKFNLN
ncbi:MAG: cell envelope integrity protein TolA [Dysgonomonas sp.]